ncbi:MAG TPA: DUF3224 domain-containing protein [Actinomycetota bacterium]
MDAYEPAPFDEQAEVPEGFQLSRTRIAKTFSGDLAGTSVTQAVTAVTQEGSAGYVAIELIVGTLQGRRGCFLLQHSATATRGAQSGSFTIVPDSGTGRLSGLSGRGDIAVDADGVHTFTLDYDLPGG